MMHRWLWAVLLTLPLASPLMAEQAQQAPAGNKPAAAPATPATPAAPAAQPGAPAGAPAQPGAAQPGATPAPVQLVKVAVPLLGQAVNTKVDLPEIGVREVLLTRKRGDAGESVVTARVKIVNLTQKVVKPCFRLYLYNGEEALGGIPFPSDSELPPELQPGASYTWQKVVAMASLKVPNAFVAVPATLATHEGNPDAAGQSKNVRIPTPPGMGGMGGAGGGRGGRGGGGRGGRGGRRGG